MEEAWASDNPLAGARGLNALLVLIDREAGHLLFAVGFQLRLKLGTGAEAAPAAGVERAARRRIQRTGQLADQLDALAA